MKRLALLVLLAGCGILDPCVPIIVERIRDADGLVAGADYVSVQAEGSCRVVSVEPYEPLFNRGYFFFRETWECGCG